MGWKLDKTFQVDPSGRDEPEDLIKTEVSGDSISDLLVIRQGANSVVLDLATFGSIADYLKRYRA